MLSSRRGIKKHAAQVCTRMHELLTGVCDASLALRERGGTCRASRCALQRRKRVPQEELCMMHLLLRGCHGAERGLLLLLRGCELCCAPEAGAAACSAFAVVTLGSLSPWKLLLCKRGRVCSSPRGRKACVCSQCTLCGSAGGFGAARVCGCRGHVAIRGCCSGAAVL
jgi:hypothetical protein